MTGFLVGSRPDPKYRYIFEDTLTGAKIRTLPMYGVNFKRYLATWGQSSTYGTFTGTVRADTPGLAVSDILEATLPGRTNVWVERDAVLIWGGLITTRTYQSQAYTYQIDAQTFDTFTQGVFQLTDQASTSDDPRNVIINLWNSMQSDSTQDMRVIIPPLVSALTPEYTYSWTGTDQNANSDLISSAVQGGAEYRLDYAYDVNGNRTCTLVLGRWDQSGVGTTIGALPGDVSTTTFKYPGSISDYWISESGPQGATFVLGIGSASGDTTPSGTLTNTGMLAQGWPKFGIKFNWTDVTAQSQLDTQLATALQQFAPPFISPTYKLNGSGDYGKFNLGDYLHIVLNDLNRFPDGPFVQDIRVLAMELSPTTDTDVEQADFTVDQPSTTG